mmetsp:Transcript_26349/g.36736  ORF Transcript_26349/g.36736 Transcript_26349/m.36736 type:complete len:321 (+) Transcript_26349:30-992(+)|eukprot:CAMPEP_0184490478 /NCGR_PEP_ID=MMETSP0113_2-20130426/17977_1 /TAXON_ID=91329 /ORGANISM="Norrisiella sphaerica, Strain BC52" /LENGTH=320 /DNA_ID=CAMNT_0026874373 /DNA_START=51 /DNA_END=1013 /DNA_ORIENTATION=+
MGNQIGCVADRPQEHAFKTIEIEKGLLELVVSSRREDKKQHSMLNRETSKWICNNELRGLSLPGGSDVENLFVKLFRISIRENHRRLSSAEYMKNIFLQTREFQDKHAEKDLEGQEISSACTNSYFRILGELWDAFQHEGDFKKTQHHNLLRGYFATFEHQGRRLIVEGVAMGSAFVSRELGAYSRTKVQKMGKHFQIQLRQKHASTIEAVYQSYLSRKADTKLFDAIFLRLRPDPHGHVARRQFQAAWICAVVGEITARSMEMSLSLEDPYTTCKAEASRRTEEDSLEEKEEYSKFKESRILKKPINAENAEKKGGNVM